MLRRSQLRKLPVILALICFLGTAVGCLGLGGLQITGEKSELFAAHKALYIQASKDFNRSFEKYLNTYDAMPPEVQKQWVKDLDPLFLKAAEALDTWELFIDQGTIDQSSEDNWLAMKGKLFEMLIQKGVNVKE